MSGGLPVTVTIRNELGHKRCHYCKLWLDEALFNKDKRRLDGLSLSCKRCRRNEHTKYRYGMTLDDLVKRLADQGDKCSICGTTLSIIGGEYRVDHDHSCCPGERSCGKCIRGLLCGNCNCGIGMLNDSVDRLQSAIKYLEEWGDRGRVESRLGGECAA